MRGVRPGQTAASRGGTAARDTATDETSTSGGARCAEGGYTPGRLSRSRSDWLAEPCVKLGQGEATGPTHREAPSGSVSTTAQCGPLRS